MKKTLDKPLEYARIETLKLIQNGLSITEIAKHRHISRQAVYDILKTLNKRGLISHNKYALYELTEKGINTLHSLIGLSYKLRQHNLSIKIKVLESPKNWDKRRSQIIIMPYFNKRIQLKNNSYDLLNYGKIQLKITSQSVIFKFPAVYTSNIDEAVLQILDLFYNAIPKVENLFKIKLIKDYKANITIISQEYARLNDSLAKLYKKEGNKLYITDEQGKVWLIADYSFSVNELETISPDRADEDMRIVHTFFNDLRKTPSTFSELKGENKEIVESIKDISKTQLLENQVIKQISDNLTKVSLKVYEITKRIKDI